MFKAIPFTNNCEISVEGIVRNNLGEEIIPIWSDGVKYVEINICDTVKILPIQWLLSISLFEVCYKEEFFNIQFIDLPNWKYANRLGKLMIYKYGAPRYKNKYRIIPNYPNYAVSKSGEVIELKTNTVLPHFYSNGYITVTLYDPLKSKKVTVSLHRVVALAWVANKDPSKYLIINHKDGNKLNPHYGNLEWTDYSGNNSHAYNTGLKYTIKLKVRNVETKEIFIFNSMSDFSRFVNISMSSLVRSYAGGCKKLIKNLYEVKHIDDNSSWRFENKENKVGSEKIRFKLIGDKGNIEIIYGFNKLAKRLNLEIFECRRKEKFEIITRAAVKLNLVILYEWLETATKEIQAYNVKTNDIVTFSSKRHAARVLKISRSIINTSLLRGERFISGNYAFRYKNDSTWDTNFTTYENTPSCIMASNNKTGMNVLCTSIRDAERKTEINAKAISKIINGMPHSFDWHFTKI